MIGKLVEWWETNQELTKLRSENEQLRSENEQLRSELTVAQATIDQLRVDVRFYYDAGE